MRRLKDIPHSTDIVVKDEGAQAGLGTDFNLLADQLALIAEDLRNAGANSRPSSEASPANFGLSTKVPQNNNSRSRALDQNLGFADTEGLRPSNAARARKIYEDRRSRPSIFGNEELFGEPAWDILLDLYIAHVEGKVSHD